MSASTFRELQKIKSPKRSFVVTDQRSRGAMLAPSGGRKHCAPTDIFLSVERLEDLYFAIALEVMRKS